MCKTQYIIADNSDYSILTLQLIARIFFFGSMACRYGLLIVVSRLWFLDNSTAQNKKA
jgi:hypothetical protein